MEYLILSILILTANLYVQAQSFDCKDARTGVELTICNSTELCKLDAKMSSLYKQVLALVEDEEEKRLFIERQKQWLQDRNMFPDYSYDSPVICSNADTLITQYKAKVFELSNLIKIYKMDKEFKKHFPKSYNQIRMVRFVPNYDKGYFLVVLDSKEYFDLRALLIFEVKNGKVNLKSKSEKVLVSRAASGRMGDMLIDIITEERSFTILTYHGMMWSHGEECTFTIDKNKITMVHGVTFSSTGPTEAVRINYMAQCSFEAFHFAENPKLLLEKDF